MPRRAARAAVDVALTAGRRRDVDHVVADVLQKGLAALDGIYHLDAYWDAYWPEHRVGAKPTAPLST